LITNRKFYVGTVSLYLINKGGKRVLQKMMLMRFEDCVNIECASELKTSMQHYPLTE